MVENRRSFAGKHVVDLKPLTLLAAAVAIVYLEKPRRETAVHQLQLDAAGNIRNAPPTCRAFFLEEEMNLLSRVP